MAAAGPSLSFFFFLPPDAVEAVSSWREKKNGKKKLTWSFLDLPVCSFPPTAPISSVSLLSFAVWMSSSPGLISKVPALHSAATASRPATISAASASVSTEVFERARAYAWLPSMSSRLMRLSEPMDALNFSMSGSVAPVKRPPQSFFSEVGGAEAEAATEGLFICARGGERREDERCCCW